MASMDIFNADAFSAFSLLDALDNIDTKPQLLGSMDLFQVRKVRTEAVAIEKRDNTLSLIKTSQRGAPPEENSPGTRDIRDFRTVRIARGDTMQASEVQNIRAFGMESELKAVATEVNERLRQLTDDLELTFENMRLGALQGVLTDADGSTIRNWFTEWGVAQPAEIDFDLDNASPASGALMTKCDQVVDAMRKAAKGSWLPTTRAVGLCGTAFWRDLMAHPEMAKLRELQTLYGDQTGLAQLLGISGSQIIEYQGVTFIRYFGTDDDSTVAIPSDKCKFFPLGARGVFQVAYSPLESAGFVNTPGRERYSLIVRDRDRDMWVRPEVYSYPLHICTKPLMLQRAKRT